MVNGVSGELIVFARRVISVSRTGINSAGDAKHVSGTKTTKKSTKNRRIKRFLVQIGMKYIQC